MAKKEGFVQISYIFEETANQEKEHAKRFFSFLEGGMVSIEYGLKGPNLSSVTACAAGTHAISDATKTIMTGGQRRACEQ
jgi:3-oxoacyl-(acyl-carrier-protein) synthase